MFDLNEQLNKSRARSTAASGEHVTALYERLSRDDDNEGESNSIVNQKSMLETHARDHGFTNCRHYTDDGFSGGNFDRPGWQQLLDDIDAGVVKTVLVKDMSRVGRNYIETGFYTEVYFARMGVRFIAINNGIDNNNPDSTEFAGILNIMNDWYLRDASRKARSAAQQKGKSGKPLAVNPCFGYVKDPENKNRWLIDPEAAATIRRVFELAASGLSQLQICRTLSREKHVTPGYYRFQHDPDGFGKRYAQRQPYQWNVRMVRNIVQRREYLGETVNFKLRMAEYRSKRTVVPPEDRLLFPDTHEAIVDAETWQAAQRIFHPEMVYERGTPSPISRLLICGECGGPMMLQRNTGDTRLNDFYCKQYAASAGYDERICTRNGIRVEIIREVVRDTLRAVNRFAISDENAFRRRVEQAASSFQPDDRKQLAWHIREKEKKVARLEHLLKKLYEDYALGHIPEERFDLLSQQYEQEEASLKVELEADQQRLAEVQATTSHTDQYLALARKYRDCDEVTDEMILAFVEKIVVYKTLRMAEGQRTRQIEVHLNYIGRLTLPMEVQTE